MHTSLKRIKDIIQMISCHDFSNLSGGGGILLCYGLSSNLGRYCNFDVTLDWTRIAWYTVDYARLSCQMWLSKCCFKAVAFTQSQSDSSLFTISSLLRDTVGQRTGVYCFCSLSVCAKAKNLVRELSYYSAPKTQSAGLVVSAGLRKAGAICLHCAQAWKFDDDMRRTQKTLS